MPFAGWQERLDSKFDTTQKELEQTHAAYGTPSSGERGALAGKGAEHHLLDVA